MTKATKLEFTGERFTPECEREIWYEHYHRYVFVKNLVQDKVVLDVASGEGYGSFLLADTAKTVTGVDIDNASIEHAKGKYNKDNLSYQQASALELPFDDNHFDVIVSFETLEHLAQHQEMLAEFNRVLKTDGILIISTPDKKHYSDDTGFDNEFHVKELYKHEFKALLDKHWSAQKWYAQGMAFHSIMQELESKELSYQSEILSDKTLIQNGNLIKPIYYVVIATQKQQNLPQSVSLHLFADKSQSVYGHYNAVIREHINYLNKYNQLNESVQKLIKTPILGRLIKKMLK